MQVETTEYARSSHDLSNAWRSTMSPGTLVPFMVQQALPGDTWEIELNAMVLTPPTVGPLLGSFKLQLDVFQVPMRLYNMWIHNNKLGIGTQMQNVKIPKYVVATIAEDDVWAINNPTEYPINNSHIIKYLGVSGAGWLTKTTLGESVDGFPFNAIPLLGYWDIFKNYYANKQEKNAYLINTKPLDLTVADIKLYDYTSSQFIQINTGTGRTTYPYADIYRYNYLIIRPTNPNYKDWNILNYLNNLVLYDNAGNKLGSIANISMGKLYESKEPIFSYPTATNSYYGLYKDAYGDWYIGVAFGTTISYNLKSWITVNEQNYRQKPILQPFELEEIDQIREELMKIDGNITTYLNNDDLFPQIAEKQIVKSTLGTIKSPISSHNNILTLRYSQNGLLLKTYQSDIFNNWLNKEAISGDEGINEITKVSTASGSFSIDALQLAYKVYRMLNDIQVTGNSYDDWQQAVYNHERFASPEIPIYEGGLSKEIIFNEIISTAQTNNGTVNQPLGTMASRGVLSNKHKGGKLRIKCNEPAYIMGIVSITPRLDYSQGNDWFTTLNTWNDLHKPALDQIGFQDLMQSQQAWFGNEKADTIWIEGSTGKQPAWINYMTNYNRTFGHFAEVDNLMYMTLNRRYEKNERDPDTWVEPIKDNTTYIDPSKFNYIFADTSIDAQNFWVQIAQKTTVRRIMSAKVMPRL